MWRIRVLPGFSGCTVLHLAMLFPTAAENAPQLAGLIGFLLLLQRLGVVRLLVNHIRRGHRHILLPLGWLESVLFRGLIRCCRLRRHINLLGLPHRCTRLRLRPPLIHRRGIVMIHRHLLRCLHPLLFFGSLLLAQDILLPLKLPLLQGILLLLLLLIPCLCLLLHLSEKLFHVHTEEQQSIPNAQQHQQNHPGHNADGLPNGPCQQHTQSAAASALPSQFPSSAEEQLKGVCRVIFRCVQVQQIIHQGQVLPVVGRVHHQCQAGSQSQIKA